MITPLRIGAALPRRRLRELRKFRERLAKIREIQAYVKHDQQADHAEGDDRLKFRIGNNRNKPRPSRPDWRNARVSSRCNRRKLAAHWHLKPLHFAATSQALSPARCMPTFCVGNL
jgi:hypothetical protein